MIRKNNFYILSGILFLFLLTLFSYCVNFGMESFNRRKCTTVRQLKNNSHVISDNIPEKTITITKDNNKGVNVTFVVEGDDISNFFPKEKDGIKYGEQIINPNFVNECYLVKVYHNSLIHNHFIEHLRKREQYKVLYKEKNKYEENKSYIFALVTTEDYNANRRQCLIYCENANSRNIDYIMCGLFQGSEATEIEILSCGESINNMCCMFADCTRLNSIYFGEKFNTTNVTDMSFMFQDCSSLTSIDLSHFNTTKVKNMSYMFAYCSWLSKVDLSSCNARVVTDMSFMFYNCTQLIELNLYNCHTSNVTNMCDMFAGCGLLRSLNLSCFNTEHVTDMSYMFAYCKDLLLLDLSNFNTENVVYMQNMFKNCTNLIELKLFSSSTCNVKDMSSMFYNCSSLEKLDLSKFDTSNVLDMSYMFCGCNGLVELDLFNFVTGNVVNMEYMFTHCISLTKLNLSNFNIKNVSTINSIFSQCFFKKVDNTSCELMCKKDFIEHLHNSSQMGSGIIVKLKLDSLEGKDIVYTFRVDKVKNSGNYDKCSDNNNYMNVVTDFIECNNMGVK